MIVINHNLRRALVVSISLLTIFVVYLYIGAELYFIPYPYINTALAPGFNWEGYRQIREGMSPRDVSDLIADQPYVRRTRFLWGQGVKTGPMFPNAYCDVYSDDKHMWGAWIAVNVCYDGASNEARVVGSNELIRFN